MQGVYIRYERAVVESNQGERERERKGDSANCRNGPVYVCFCGWREVCLIRMSGRTESFVKWIRK